MGIAGERWRLMAVSALREGASGWLAGVVRASSRASSGLAGSLREGAPGWFAGVVRANSRALWAGVHRGLGPTLHLPYAR